jgi:hypothetical protein
VKSSTPEDPLLTIRLPRKQVKQLDRLCERCAASGISEGRHGTRTSRNALFIEAIDLLQAKIDAKLGPDEQAPEEE